MSFIIFSCRNCGAGVEAPPDNLLVMCTYCGSRYPSKELGDIPISIISSGQKEDVEEAVFQRMKQDAQMKNVKIEIESIFGVYIPIFMTKTAVKGSWKGYRNVRRNKRTVKVFKEGNNTSTGDYPILGRKHAYEFGMASIGQVIFDQEVQSFEDVDWNECALPVLAVDLEEEKVDLLIKDHLLNQMGERIKERHNLTSITNFEADIQLKDRGIVLFPFWTVLYRYKGGTYRMAVSGGDLQVLAAMEPVFLGRRLWAFIKGVGALIGTGILCQLIVPLVYSESDDAGAALLALGVGVLFCAKVAWSTASQMTASIQVEQLGVKEELVS